MYDHQLSTDRWGLTRHVFIFLEMTTAALSDEDQDIGLNFQIASHGIGDKATLHAIASQFGHDPIRRKQV